MQSLNFTSTLLRNSKLFRTNSQNLFHQLILLHDGMYSKFTTSSLDVRKITPPCLGDANFGQKILCYRPVRTGIPRMEVESVNRKVVAHNYGHGGSGWTLAPGCATYVNDLLIKYSAEHSTNINLNTDAAITIVGAGVIGLFSAYDLLNKGFKNLTIMADKFDELTSHNAGGLLAPVSLGVDSSFQKVVKTAGVDSFKFYKSIAKAKHQHFKTGAVIIPAYFSTRMESGLEPYVGSVMEPAKDVTLDFGNGKLQTMVSYDDGIFINTSEMMTSLKVFLQERNVGFVHNKLLQITDVESNFIINCSGLGAAHLVEDSRMVSVQGHLIMLQDQNPEDLKYMITVNFGEGKTSIGQKIKRAFYMFPKKLHQSSPRDIGVIGGTFIENGTPETPNYDEYKSIVQTARNFFGFTEIS